MKGCKFNLCQCLGNGNDILTKNMFKAFNLVFMSAMAKLIVRMIEEIRVYFMEIWEKIGKMFSKYKVNILPNIKND